MRTCQRILIMADTHGFLDPRIATWAGRCDTVVHAGDIGGSGIIAELRRSAPRVIAIRGNNDTPENWRDGGASALEALGWEACVSLLGGCLAVVHGHQAPAARRHRWLRRRFPESRAIVYGHSHRMIVDRQATPWILNPGASGRSRTFGGPSCLWLQATPGTWQVRVIRYPPLPPRGKY